MKTRILTWIITIGAFLNEAYAVLSANQSILSELGVPDKVTRVIMLIGLLWTAFSKSLAEPKK